MSNRFGQNGFGVGRGLINKQKINTRMMMINGTKWKYIETSCLQPHILAVGTRLIAFLNPRARGDHFAGGLLQASNGDPARRVLRIGLNHRAQQHARFLNVGNFGVG
jgi:hypothetical protein